MFSMPASFNEFLKERGLLNEIYQAMNSDDYSDVVMVVLNVLERSCSIPMIPKERKCEAKSNEYRNQGNVAFQAGIPQKALEFYNRALMYAPKGSKAMKLAYSNRSALLFKYKKYKACLADIETCNRLGCPPEIAEKLSKRKKAATTGVATEEMVSKLCEQLGELFKLKSDRNIEIPCASTDVKVIDEANDRKIVAAKHIKVGTLLALEPSYVSCNELVNMPFSCHYCHKMSLNLLPCENCCFVLFCSEECKELCSKEYHNIECQIMEVIMYIAFGPLGKLMIIGTLKFIQKCGSWKEVISASKCTGSERTRLSSVQEIYDVNNNLSVLNFNDDRLFIHGNMYSASFVCATIVHHLEKIPKFLPKSQNLKTLAKQALGRLMIYFSIYGIPSEVVVTVSNITKNISRSHLGTNNGWYPFIGKLKNNCVPNTIVINVNKEAALIAIQPIEQGSELTVSFMDYYLHRDYDVARKKNCLSFVSFGYVCNCIVCTGEWKLQQGKTLLSKNQLDVYNKFILQPQKNFKNTFQNLCEALTCLHKVPFSEEYIKVYTEFRKLIMSCEEYVGQNFLLDDIL